MNIRAAVAKQLLKRIAPHVDVNVILKNNFPVEAKLFKVYPGICCPFTADEYVDPSVLVSIVIPLSLSHSILEESNVAVVGIDIKSSTTIVLAAAESVTVIS